MNWEQANKNLDERRQKALLGGGQSKIDKQHAGGGLIFYLTREPLWKPMLSLSPESMILIWIREECRETVW